METYLEGWAITTQTTFETKESTKIMFEVLLIWFHAFQELAYDGC